MLAALTLAAPVSGAWATQPVPVVTAVSPSSGPVSGGTKVTIRGSGFLDATSVRFASAQAAFTVVSDTTITATAPARPSGPAHVVVTTPAGGSAMTGDDLFTYLPAIGDLSVSSGTVSGGTKVTITGSGFTGATKVEFGDRPADFDVVSDSRIEAVSPPGGRGDIDVSATANGATTLTVAADRFTYLLRVTGISPGSGAGGAQVHVLGIGFDDATAVHFDASFSGFVIVSDTELIAIAPSGGGSADITVVTPHGTTAVTRSARFSYGGGTAGSVTVSAAPGSQPSGSQPGAAVQVSPTTSTGLELRLLGGLTLAIPPQGGPAVVRATLFLGRPATTVVSVVDPHGRLLPVLRTARAKPARSLTVRSRAGKVSLRLLVPAKSLVRGRRYSLLLGSRDAAGRRATLRLPLDA